MKHLFFIIVPILFSCSSSVPDEMETIRFQFDAPRKVVITGYDDDVMEPFLSRDGKWLFFNNSNDPSVNTNIFYATRINDTVFRYNGELPGVNSPVLDGVPTMDRDGNFYFVSPRTYLQTLSVVYRGEFRDSNVSNIGICPGISKNEPGRVNFDVEVSADGNTLYSVDAVFDANYIPQTADIFIAERTGPGFQRKTDADMLLRNVNSGELEYAAGISDDELTLYFTRLTGITANAVPHIFYATRKNRMEQFGHAYEIKEAEGFVEGATVSGDSLLYFHKKENSKFALYCLRKK
jgi:hypothetical protein